MNARLRSLLLLVVTLVVGLVIGAAGSREIARLWLPGGPPRAGERDNAGGSPFAANMERAIAPRDAAQQAAVRAIIDKTAESNGATIRATNQQLRVGVDSMRAQLAPLLDSAQLKRLDEAMRRLPPIGPRGGPQGGPQGGPRGPGPARGGPPFGRP